MNVLEGFRLKIYNGSKNMVADLNEKSGNKKYIVFKCNGILKEIDLTGIEDEFVKALYMCEIDTLNDFYDNGFRNGFSDYVGRVSYNNNDNIKLSTRFRFDRINLSLNHAENSVYVGRDGNYLTMGHIWDSKPIDIYSTNDQDTNEIMSGAGIKLTKRFGIQGSLIFNAYEHILQRHGAGIYYEHPCYYLSLEYKRDNAVNGDYIGNTTFQFKFGISIDGRHY